MEKGRMVWMPAGCLLALLLVSAGLPGGAGAGDDCGGLAGQIHHGEVLWTSNAIVVQGTAAPNLGDPNASLAVIKRTARQAALLDAYRKAAGVLHGIQVCGERLGSDTRRVTTQISAFMREPQVCRTKYYADGGVDVVALFPLQGDLLFELLPQAGSRVATASSSKTGLIVDATGLGFAPALMPRLISPSGEILFGPASVRAEVIRAGRAVAYVRGPRQIDPARVGGNPLRIRPLGLGPDSPSDLVVDAQDAGRLQDGPAFLGDGKVVVIIDPRPVTDCRDLAATVGERRVDWRRRLVLARGRGRVDFERHKDDAVRMRTMERAAEVDAQGRLLEALLAVNVDGRRLKDLPGAADVAAGSVRNAWRCDAKYFRDGTAEVVLAAPIDAIALREAPGKARPAGDAAPATAREISGLIIDAAGLAFEPILAPRILAADGTELFGPGSVARAWMRRYGMVGYHSDRQMAAADDRVGPRPLKVTAARLGADSHSLVLGTEDTGRWQRIGGLDAILRRGRVIIIVAGAAAGASAQAPAATLRQPEQPQTPSASDKRKNTGQWRFEGKIVQPDG